jgi:hypothetical protein
MAWGALACLLGWRAYGPAIWVGVIASPAVGLTIGRLLQARFESGGPGLRWFISATSLYLGATLFALLIGVGTMLGLAPGNRRFPLALLEPVLGTWWGITLTGFVVGLWPLTYATHWWLEWRGRD